MNPEPDNNDDQPKKRGRKPKVQTPEQKQSITVPVCSIVNKPILIKLKLTREDTERINKQLAQMYSKEYTVQANVSPTAFNNVDSDVGFVSVRPVNKSEIQSADHQINESGKLISLPEIFSKGVWPEKTNIKCWWCTLSFESVPCFVPTKMVNGKYTVLGCFCSFNCAMAYNLYALEQNQHDRLRKCALLNSLYYEIHGEPKEILPSPPKETMIMYGGKLSIEQYCNLIKDCNVSSYKIIYPPISGISFQLEDINKNTSNTTRNIGNSTGTNYVLERSTPPPNNRKKVTNKFIKIIQ
jgi:hypothetical protein